MKILHVNTSDMIGGASKAAYRLHRALLAAGVNSRMLVGSKQTLDDTVLGPSSKIGKVAPLFREYGDHLPVKIYRERVQTPFSLSWLPFSSIVKRINSERPDIVHLHWICHGMMRIADLQKIDAPVVWTLHDDWAYTGGCHVKLDCEKYKTNCVECPRLGSNSRYDLARWTFRRKSKVYPRIEDLYFIGVSNWITSSAKQGRLLNGRQVHKIANPIPLDTFKPIDKDVARSLWNLPKDKKLIAFGAVNATSDPNKGFEALSKALALLRNDDVELVVFGSGSSGNTSLFNRRTHFLGRIHDDVGLVTLYNAVDLVVVPSYQESFSLVATEAMACGTPVVAFAHSGLVEIVNHQQNGYLAQPFEHAKLAVGIDWVLNHNAPQSLAQQARKKIVDLCASEQIAARHIALYETILGTEEQQYST